MRVKPEDARRMVEAADWSRTARDRRAVLTVAERRRVPVWRVLARRALSWEPTPEFESRCQVAAICFVMFLAALAYLYVTLPTEAGGLQ